MGADSSTAMDVCGSGRYFFRETFVSQIRGLGGPLAPGLMTAELTRARPGLAGREYLNCRPTRLQRRDWF